MESRKKNFAIFIIIGMLLINISTHVMASENKKNIVLGGGIIGVTSAYYLAKAGYNVIVVEQNNDVAKVGSFANGAQLCYSCIQPLYSSSFFNKFLQLFETLKVNHPLFKHSIFKPLENYLYSKAFNKELTDYRNQLFGQSSETFNALVQEWNLTFPYQRNGVLQLFFTEEHLNKAIQSFNYKKRHGIKLDVLTTEECLQKEPALRFSQKDIKGGIFVSQDGTGDAHLFTKALSEICRTLGVKFLLNTEIEKVNCDDKRIISLITKNNESLAADAYVVALGVNSKPFLSRLGIELMMKFVKGYSISIELEEQDTLPSIGLAEPNNEIFYAKLGNTLRVAGLTEDAELDITLNDEKINLLIAATDDLFPHLKVREKDKTGKIHKWACIRPSSLDKVPFITTTRFDNLFINTGHGGFGWTLAPISGKRLAEIIKEKI